MTGIFTGSTLDMSASSGRALDGDTWFENATNEIGGFDEIRKTHSRIEHLEADLRSRTIPTIDRTSLSSQIIEGAEVDYFAVAREADELARTRQAHALLSIAIDDARSELRGQAYEWIRAHQDELLKLLHAERSCVASQIREKVDALGGVTDMERLSYRPDLAAVVAEIVPLVAEWRAHRVRHRAITGITDEIVVRNGEFRPLPMPHLDWIGDYEGCWPEFYRMHADTSYPFPWSDGTALDFALLLSAFPTVWTPTQDEFLRAREQLTVTARRLVVEEAKAAEAQLRQGPKEAPQRIHERRIEPPAYTPQRAISHPSRIG